MAVDLGTTHQSRAKSHERVRGQLHRHRAAAIGPTGAGLAQRLADPGSRGPSPGGAASQYHGGEELDRADEHEEEEEENVPSSPSLRPHAPAARCSDGEGKWRKKVGRWGLVPPVLPVKGQHGGDE